MNSRAPKMWEQIIQHVDFAGKSVIDLGCGTGDFLLYAAQAGAAWVVGVDIDPSTARQAKKTCKDNGVTPVILVDDIANLPADSEYDIAICFSVLPYVENQIKVMRWMHDSAKLSLVEMQYANDGPGPKAIADDLDMLRFLELVWDKPVVIGRSEVGGRGIWRTIWAC